MSPLRSDPPSRLAAVLQEAAAFAFFLFLAAVATRPLCADLAGQTLAGPDPLIDLWTVHWLTSHALEPSRLFGGNIFFPDPAAILYSDLSIGTAVLLLPLRPFVSDPVLLYNLGVLVALAFGGWSFHALARDLTGSRSAGLLAGVLAAFGSHQLFHVYHLNLLSMGWIALLLLALHQLSRQPSWARAGLAGVSFALAAQSSGYYAVAGAMLALVFAVVHWRRMRDRRVFACAVGAALIGALLLAPYASAFLAVREREGLRRPPGMSAKMAFGPRDLSGHGYLYRTLLGGDGERLFPGLLSLALGAIALRRRRPASGFYAAAVVVLIAFSLGPRVEMGSLALPLPYRGLFAIPPLDSMRHPYTFAAVATFLLAVLAAIGWASLGLAQRPWAGAVVVALALAETLVPPVAVRPIAPGLPSAYQRLASLPPGAVLEVPPFAPEPLVWAARSGRSVANGVGAFAPGTTMVLERTIQNHWLKRVPDDVDQSPPTEWLAANVPLRYLILPVGRKPVMKRLADAFDRSRAFVFVAEADGDRIYEFRKENLR